MAIKMISSYEKYSKIRDSKGLTDYAVSKATGISTATISHWKQGMYSIKIDKLMAIAYFLDVDFQRLME